MNADVVIIDEIAGYQIARLLDLPVVRTLSVLKVAKDKEIISEIRPVVEQMIQKGRWYSKNVIDKFLSDVGE
jgi:predicted nucleic acid-binding protein